MTAQTDFLTVKASASRLRERNRELYPFLKLSNSLAASLHMRAIFDGALSQIPDRFHLDAGRIYLLHQSGEFPTLASCKGMNPKGLETIELTERYGGPPALPRRVVAAPANHVGLLADAFSVAGDDRC